MLYTPEQQAIQEFLSKPEPCNGACCCMGPQQIKDVKLQSAPFVVKLDKANDRVKALKTIRQLNKLSLQEAQAALAENSFGFEYDFQVKRFTQELVNAGLQYEVKVNPTGYYPVCPCAMSYVSEVEGNFYQVHTHRSHNGITYTTELLGPVGGPYKKQANLFTR
jgi:hypothetical protein